MLKNAPALAIGGVDTAENGAPKVWVYGGYSGPNPPQGSTGAMSSAQDDEADTGTGEEATTGEEADTGEEVDASGVVKVMRDGAKVTFSDEELAQHFHDNKMHPSASDWEYAMAVDMVHQARLFFMSLRAVDGWLDHKTHAIKKALKKKLGRAPVKSDIDNDLVRKWYAEMNSHGAIGRK